LSAFTVRMVPNTGPRTHENLTGPDGPDPRPKKDVDPDGDQARTDQDCEQARDEHADSCARNNREKGSKRETAEKASQTDSARQKSVVSTLAQGLWATMCLIALVLMTLARGFGTIMHTGPTRANPTQIGSTQTVDTLGNFSVRPWLSRRRRRAA
jgi:hypothetical protein